MCVHRTMILLSGLILVLSGCDAVFNRSGDEGQLTPTAGEAGYRCSGVAVVDLDEVARQLGSDVSIVQAIRESQASLNRQLQSLQMSLQEQYQQKKRELEIQLADGKQAQATGVKQLEGFGQQLNLQLGQARQKAKSQIDAHRQAIIKSFRDEIKPVAQEVARERGLGVVITKNDNVLLTFDHTHDITAAVVQKLLARRAASPAVANRPAPPATTHQ